MKAFQTPHQVKFLERWQHTLADFESRPTTGEENRSQVFQAGRKQILVLDEHTPRIDSDSGSLRLFHLMQCLQHENCDLHFLPADLAFDNEHTIRLQQLGISCQYRPWTKSVPGWLRQNAAHFDVIIVCRVSLLASIFGTLRDFAPRAKLVFDTVDLHHVREAQEADIAKSESLKKQAQATKEKEYRLIGRCDETWVVSETERLALQAAFPEKCIRLISNIHAVRHATPGFSKRNSLLFVGNFRHPPNEDGLRWFLEAIWPIIRNRNPAIALHIVGASPPENLIRPAMDTNIVFHGHVMDIEAVIDSCRVNIAPLRYGAGAKGKISQSLASGLPTVATTIAADGMHLVDRESILIADDAGTFADRVLDLYDDDMQWNRLSKNGYAVAEEFFSGKAASIAIHSAISNDSTI